MATAVNSTPMWKRALWLVLRIYAGLCTLLITVYLVFVVWNLYFNKQARSVDASYVLMQSLGEYMAKEHPKRADRFLNLAASLSSYLKDAPISTADLFKYLGKPDLIAGTTETGTVAYLYDQLGATNKWAVYAFLQDGKLMRVGFNDSGAHDPSVYRPYSAQ